MKRLGFFKKLGHFFESWKLKGKKLLNKGFVKTFTWLFFTCGVGAVSFEVFAF